MQMIPGLYPDDAHIYFPMATQDTERFHGLHETKKKEMDAVYKLQETNENVVLLRWLTS